MNRSSLFYSISGITPGEFQLLQHITADLTDDQVHYFVSLYSSKRRSPNEILIFTLLGLVVIAGVQRFITRQIGMGILYFFTAGLCFIGTIVDAINHRSIAFEYNEKIAYECRQMVSRI